MPGLLQNSATGKDPSGFMILAFNCSLWVLSKRDALVYSAAEEGGLPAAPCQLNAVFNHANPNLTASLLSPTPQPMCLWPCFSKHGLPGESLPRLNFQIQKFPWSLQFLCRVPSSSSPGTANEQPPMVPGCVLTIHSTQNRKIYHLLIYSEPFIGAVRGFPHAYN